MKKLLIKWLRWSLLKLDPTCFETTEGIINVRADELTLEQLKKVLEQEQIQNFDIEHLFDLCKKANIDLDKPINYAVYRHLKILQGKNHKRFNLSYDLPYNNDDNENI